MTVDPSAAINASIQCVRRLKLREGPCFPPHCLHTHSTHSAVSIIKIPGNTRFRPLPRAHDVIAVASPSRHVPVNDRSAGPSDGGRLAFQFVV